MKKTVICNIPMQPIKPVNYASNDKSVPTADHEVYSPVNTFLEKTLKPTDEVNVILLVTIDGKGQYEEKVNCFKNELDQANASIGAAISYTVINVDFSQSKYVHDKLLGDIVEKLEVGTHIIADITYGSKAFPIIIFTALNFAEKFLKCQVDNILYGQVTFKEGNPVDPKIYDVVPLYCLNSVTNLIHSVEPEKAKAILKMFLSV